MSTNVREDALIASQVCVGSAPEAEMAACGQGQLEVGAGAGRHRLGEPAFRCSTVQESGECLVADDSLAGEVEDRLEDHPEVEETKRLVGVPVGVLGRNFDLEMTGLTHVAQRRVRDRGAW